MLTTYGFIVKKEEIQDVPDSKSILVEEETGTVFVEFYEIEGRIFSSLYYRPGFAKDQFTTIERLKERFPKSFHEGNVNDEYQKLLSCSGGKK